MKDIKSILQEEEPIEFNLTPRQKQLLNWAITIGMMLIVIGVLLYIMHYIDLLNTNPCDLCYKLGGSPSLPKPNISAFHNVSIRTSSLGY